MGATSEHFSAAELQCHHGINICTQRLVDGLEAFRAIVGKPVKVNDATRCPACNERVGGAKNSQHELGGAADIQADDMSPQQLYQVALQVPSFHGGGIGVSLFGSYIHVDVRQASTGPARWCYDVHGKETAWDHSLDIATPKVTS